MQLNSTEISELIKQRIAQFNVVSEAHNEGTIVSVSDGVIRIHGLADCMQGEMISLPGNRYAIALNLERDSVGAVVMGPYADLAEGMKVKCTGRILEVPVGRGLLGRVVNTLGAPIDGKGPLDHDGFSAVEAIAPGVIERQSVDQPVQTGYKAVDSMIPIGRGQRELIIGDRQTGKTALAIDAIINQRDSGIKCIYVAIGQKASTISNVVRKLPPRPETQGLTETYVGNWLAKHGSREKLIIASKVSGPSRNNDKGIRPDQALDRKNIREALHDIFPHSKSTTTSLAKSQKMVIAFLKK